MSASVRLRRLVRCTVNSLATRSESRLTSSHAWSLPHSRTGAVSTGMPCHAPTADSPQNHRIKKPLRAATNRGQEVCHHKLVHELAARPFDIESITLSDSQTPSFESVDACGTGENRASSAATAHQHKACACRCASRQRHGSAFAMSLKSRMTVAVSAALLTSARSQRHDLPG